MSADSFLVDTRLSLVIANPQHFPMNMEKTSREDYPVDSYPIMAYDASNVLATPFGYKSFFDETTKLNIGNLPTLLVQEVFTYQTTNLDSLQFALCEDGVYVAFATLPTGVNWAKIIDTSAGLVVGVRRLWTVATIGNYVYMYQAGQPKFWAIVDAAKYAEAATPSLIVGATRTQVWTNWGAGIISYIPSFLNMAGQIGLFRADNRLGFWDSDNSIGWSSSVAIEDFKPDAKTFAGSTKFADVQGRIVKVLGSGDSFIIYATRSIVNCVGSDNSPEKWRGEAIMSEVGISFDTQVVAAQPDQIHYCITQAGICSITNGTPEYIATEVMDYIAENFALYSLFLIEGRYLFISVNGTFPGSEYGTESIIVKDFNNNEFKFPRPTYPAEEDLKDYLEEAMAGRNGETQQAFPKFEPIVDVSTIPDDKALEPCYDVSIFKSTWADSTFSPLNAGDKFFYSKITPAVSYYQNPLYKAMNVTNNFIEEDDLAPGDFHGEVLGEKILLGVTAFNNQITYQNAFISANGADTLVDFFEPDTILPPDYDGTTITVPWPKELIAEYLRYDALSPDDVKVLANECRIKVYTDKLRTLTTKVYFEGTETFSSARKVYEFKGTTGLHTIGTIDADSGFYYCKLYNNPTNHLCLGGAGGYEQLTWSDIGISALNLPNVVLLLPRELSDFDAFQAYVLAATGYVNYTVDTNVYAQWCLEFRYDQVISIGYEKAAYKARLFAALQAQVAIYTAQGVLPNSPGNKLKLHPILTEDCYNGGWLVSEQPGIRWMPAGTDPITGIYSAYSKIDTGKTTPYQSGDPDYKVLWDISNPMVDIEVRWSAGDLAALAATWASPGYRLEGTLSREITLEPDAATESVIFDMEMSGWGYIPTGGFSFRKTHNRHSSTTCPYPGDPISTTLPTDLDKITLPPLDRPEVNNPPYNWKYPATIPLPDNYALFQKGSLAAYYPVYGSAAVYDLLLQKWGLYNNSHKLIQELMPVNRIDSSVMPVPDKGMFAGAVSPLGACSVFKDKNPMSRITYGKMAFYRRGMSMATGAIAHFGDLATGTLVVEASMDGITVDPLLSYAVPFVNQRNVTLPFTTRAKWFNIRVEGNFNITYLELLAESRGRR